VVDEKPLKKAMFRFSRNVLLLSLAISHPDRGPDLSRVALPVRAADAADDRESRRLPRKSGKRRADHRPSDRGDEIGVAERELSDMQRDLVSMLHQKSRLAALGLAVSKINHDLRNLLASSQLMSDQLASVPDPRVQRFAPKLMRSLERAIAFCQSTLSYGKAQEAPPDRRMIPIEPIVNEVRESAGLAARTAQIEWISAIERGLTVDADPDQLFRVLLNLVRNAAQALDSEPNRRSQRAKQIRFTGRREGASRDHSGNLGYRPRHSREGQGASVRSVSGLFKGRRHRPWPRHCGRTGPCSWRHAKLGRRRAPVAQLDRAPDYESGGQRFESFRARH
jgi:signal transduction histidine kinase